MRPLFIIGNTMFGIRVYSGLSGDNVSTLRDVEGLNRGTGSTLGGPSRFLRSLSLGFQFLDRISNPVTNMSSTGREPLGGGGVPFRSGCYLSSSTSLLLSSSSNSLGVISALYQLPQLQA